MSPWPTNVEVFQGHGLASRFNLVQVFEMVTQERA